LGRRYLREPYRPLDYWGFPVADYVLRLRVCVIRAPPVGATLDLPNQGEAMRVWTDMRAGSLVSSVVALVATTVRVGGHN
jgi:hypothetical protein